MGYAWIINHLGGMHIHVTIQSCGFCHKNKDVSMKHRESSHEYIIWYTAMSENGAPPKWLS